MEKGDTTMLFPMERTERGSSFQIKELYFESDQPTLIGNYDSILTDYLLMFRNHPEVNFLVKGYVESYGVNAEADMLLSLDRAKAVKQWFVSNGIDSRRITTAGMTKNEIKRAAAAALNEKGGGYNGVKVELIITGKGDK
jgi:outer membrane protein OmpA-like peptidoglycan-associated protein